MMRFKYILLTHDNLRRLMRLDLSNIDILFCVIHYQRKAISNSKKLLASRNLLDKSKIIIICMEYFPETKFPKSGPVWPAISFNRIFTYQNYNFINSNEIAAIVSLINKDKINIVICHTETFPLNDEIRKLGSEHFVEIGTNRLRLCFNEIMKITGMADWSDYIELIDKKVYLRHAV